MHCPRAPDTTKPQFLLGFTDFLEHGSHSQKKVFCVALKAFLDMVSEWLPKIPAGIHFLVFASTLQRGGTCEAHGINPKLAPDLMMRALFEPS